ncbi:5-formyltetrahydrofolate cyclo-ligase [Desulfovibrio sp. X2]|nr:5-formyltetrahydrofolate cyclo-ligase [Desulfovibrio sp. X2]
MIIRMKTIPYDDKGAIRSRMTARRRELSPTLRASLSARAQARIMALPAFAEAAVVLLYSPVRGETATEALIDALWARGATVLLPRCRPEEPGCMDLACVSCAADLRPGSFGILEPDPARCPPLEDLQGGVRPDLAIIPGVAFDRSGMRLGMGAGYYDRLLAAPGMEHCLRLGLAYDFQIVTKLPREPWDCPMHIVISENETIEVAL